MPAPIAQPFSTEAVPVSLGANKPLSLDDPDSAWMVEAGYVDVFMVPLRHNTPTGARQHLFRVAQGEMLLGVDPSLEDSRLGFLGIGSNETRLLQVTRSQLQPNRLEPDAVVHLTKWLETWIEHWYAAAKTEQAPKHAALIKAGQQIEHPAGASVGPWDSFVWLRQPQGRSQLAGIHGADQTSTWLPVGELGWLQAAEDGVLEATDTAARLQEGFPSEGLSELYRLMRICLDHRIAASAQSEGRRLQARERSQERTVAGAVSQLASLLGPSDTGTPFESTARDPLLAACQVVGDALDVTFKPAPRQEEGSEVREPLAQLAAASNVRYRKVVLSGQWWQGDTGPLLAYLESNNQPVALMPALHRSYALVLVDPTAHTRTPLTAELAREIKPVAYSFNRPFPERALKLFDVIRFGLKHTASDLLMIGLMGVCGGLLGLLTPVATGLIFDSIIPSAERFLLLQMTLALLAAALGMILFDLTRSIALLRLETRSDVSIQSAVWDRLLSLPVPFFREYTTGDLAERANGINTIRQMLSGAVMNSLLAGIFSLFSFALLFYYSLELALVATVLVVVNVAVTLLASLLNLRLQRPLYAIYGKLSGLVLQLVTGIAKLRVAGAERHGYSVWAQTFGAMKKLQLKAGRLFSAFDVFHAVFPILTSMVLFASLAFWLEETLSTGQFLAFNAAFGGFLGAMMGLGSALVSVLDVVPIYERAKPILQSLPEVDEARTDPGELAGRIEVSHVSFAYEAGATPVLHDVSLQVNPGESVAIVGPSGSGKSTLLRLLLGFETPSSGTIHFDGHDLVNLDLRAVRRQFGVVLQNAKLFPGTILENIVGTSLLSSDDAWEAAEKAGLKEDVEAMPMGMHTVLSEGAGTLSGGQRQRLIIARAVVTRPRIVLFDEATSALDNRTQKIVSQSLDRLQATRIVIAHRLSTIMNADRIFVLQAGRLVQQGTYQELLHQPGPFAELAQRQMA